MEIRNEMRNRASSDHAVSLWSTLEYMGISLGYPRLNTRGPDGSGLDRNLV